MTQILHDKTIVLETFIYNLLRPTKHGFFIECGANDGLYRSTCLLLEKKCLWTGINVEANPECFYALSKNRPDCLNINLALSNKDDQPLEFVVVEDHRKKLSGANCLREDFDKRKKKIGDRASYSVKTITYKTLIEKYDPIKVDFFALDVEGHEEKAIDGMRGSALLPTWVCVEHVHSDKNVLKELIENLGYLLEYDLAWDWIFKKN